MGSQESRLQVLVHCFTTTCSLHRESYTYLAAGNKALSQAIQALPWCHVVYVCGGIGAHGHTLRSVERFDVKHGTWKRMPPMHYSRCCAGIVAVAGLLYVFGGSTGQLGQLRPITGVERFNIQLHTWEVMPRMTRPRAGASITVLMGNVNICGGADNGFTLSSTEVFDVISTSWKWMPPMLEARCGAAAAVINEQLYCCGGRSKNFPALRSVEMFDPKSSIWVQMPPMDKARSFCPDRMYRRMAVCQRWS